VLTYVLMHLVFWAIEYIHYTYCCQDFWISLLAKHSQPCIMLRDLSTATRSISGKIITVTISAFTAVPIFQFLNKDEKVRPEN